VVSLSPVLTSAFARAFLPDQRLTVLGVLGLLLGLLGVALLARPDPSRLLSGQVQGELLVFGAAVSFALGSVLTQTIEADLPIETMEAWSMVGGALLMHVVALALGERVADAAWTPEAVAAIGYLAVVASALGFLVYFDLLDRLGPVEINLVSYVAPVFAAVSGALVLGERVDALTALGFLVIVLGFVLVKREAIRQEWPRFRAALVRE
jgi:drug/metabolite transporter (DMT)-like permease